MGVKSPHVPMSLESEIKTILKKIQWLIEENQDICDESFIKSLNKMNKQGRIALMQLEEYGKRN